MISRGDPSVSVVIPTFNHAKFLRAALESVRAQTFVDWEIVVVNNFSEDETVAVVESFEDPRIRLVNFANHGVIAAARNHGLSLTQAPFVAFLDSDDSWYPEKLRLCMDKLAYGYDLVCHAEVWVGPGERLRPVHYGPEERATYEGLLLNGNCISTSAVVLRRSWLDRVGQFNENPRYVTAEDYELWLKLAKEGAKFGFIDKVLGIYRIHDSNNSRLAISNMQAVLNIFEVYKHSLDSKAKLSRFKHREAMIYYSGARALQNNGKHNEANIYYQRAIITCPFVLRFYISTVLNLFHLKWF
jgi:glycosyltransferase involved in cell wall biosynthesis